ncbi:MAG: helix-turn-helix domain-containing protein [Planctomycetes bacterium]|nr:helix-turn-helix domain-containing protein [Planctomycetota bacterium]
MPTYALSEDSWLSRAIEDWRITAPEEVDTIGGWRDASPIKREEVYWSGMASTPFARPEAPKHFWGDTGSLVGQVTARHPKLDPTPLQDIYEAVAAWYADHDASRIPPQPVLFATLERAITVVNAIEHGLRTQLLFEDDRELIQRLLLAKEPPRLSVDELDRLRSHLEAPADASFLHRDTKKPPHRRKLQDILNFNHELRQSGKNRSGKSRKTRKRSRATRTEPTRRMNEAFKLREQGYTYRQIGAELGISHETARKWVLFANTHWERESRSVRTQRLPLDRRGQADLPDCAS